MGQTIPKNAPIIDDLRREAPAASIGTSWQLFTDQVMGGVSTGTMSREVVGGRLAIRMRGDIRLENNGGFVQMALDLSPDSGVVDASAWSGIELDLYGDDQEYGMHLRTSDLTRPWQSYRQSFRALPKWQTIRLPFASFSPYRTEIPLDLRRLRRLGLAAIGRPFSADLAIGGLRFLS
ncbi:MAG: CIA30 family protein [Alphaproteobacteria bacterium]|nr:CIA30 family protein [Alphaproteobacteria bacterium]